MSQSQTQDNRAVEVFVDDSESGSVQGIQKRSRKRSEVWKHFNEAEPTKVKCKHCHNIFVHGPKMGTTHLHRHLESGCKDITKEERDMYMSGKVDDFFQSSNFRFDPELSRNLITLLFIDAKIPFYDIDTRFWEPTMRSLNPAYKSVKRQTLRNDCIEVFKMGTDVSLTEFEGLNSQVCFTSDIWTSSMNLGYLCLTAHYIDKDFKFHKKIIVFRQIPYPHTGLAVANLVEKILIK
jgi:BED zinc finger